MEVSAINTSLSLLPQWGMLGAFIFIVVLLVGGFLWYLCRRDGAHEALTRQCFDVIRENTKAQVMLERSIITLSEDIRDSRFHAKVNL